MESERFEKRRWEQKFPLDSEVEVCWKELGIVLEGKVVASDWEHRTIEIRTAKNELFVVNYGAVACQRITPVVADNDMIVEESRYSISIYGETVDFVEFSFEFSNFLTVAECVNATIGIFNTMVSDTQFRNYYSPLSLFGTYSIVCRETCIGENGDTKIMWRWEK